MTSGEKELLRLIQKHAYNTKRLAEVEERLKGRTYGITPSYNNTGGGRASGNHSKVEDFVEKTGKLKEAIEEYRRQIQVAEAALRCPDLTPIEGRILGWVASGGRLAAFADRECIYISRVYKLRDRALRKAHRHIKNT